jgi:hypothetical protein
MAVEAHALAISRTQARYAVYENEQRIRYYRDMAAAAMQHATNAATPDIKHTYIELALSWKALAAAATKFAGKALSETEDRSPHGHYLQ